MAIIKNPFRKQDENVRPQVTQVNSDKKEANGVKQIDIDNKQPTEYKLSGMARIGQLIWSGH